MLGSVREDGIADAGRLAAARANELDVRNMELPFHLRDPAFGIFLALAQINCLVIDLLDQKPRLFRKGPHHAAFFPAILALGHDHFITFTDLHNLNDLRRERNDLGKITITELTGYGAKNAGPARVLLVIDQDNGIR